MVVMFSGHDDGNLSRKREEEKLSQPLESARQFVAKGANVYLEPLGDGNINDTYLVRSEVDFVLQCINARVFPKPRQVVSNFVTVTEYINSQVDDCSNGWQPISLLRTRTGDICYCDSKGKIWRAQSYVKGTCTHAVITSFQQASQVGWALGTFHTLLKKLPAKTLEPSLPDLHNLPKYLKVYQQNLQHHPKVTSPLLDFCLEKVDSLPECAVSLEKLCNGGELTVGVIHGDPKVDNVLFQLETDKAVGLIDLDTVSVGPLHYDIGDCLRSCCNILGEKERDRGKVTFDLELCREILKGYFSSCQTFTGNDRRYIYEAVLAITSELAVRFVSDYLIGNRYFKVTSEEENLHRAALQFHLVDDIIAKEERIREIGVE